MVRRCGPPRMVLLGGAGAGDGRCEAATTNGTAAGAIIPVTRSPMRPRRDREVVVCHAPNRQNPRRAAEARHAREQAGHPDLLADPRAPRPCGQSWATFRCKHAHEIWACDFLPVTDLCSRPLFASFVVALGCRRVVHVEVTRHPNMDDWVARQLREATPFGKRPRLLIRDNDAKYGAQCDQVVAASGIRMLRTPVRAPQANATCARSLRSVRRECLDHMLVLGERQLGRVLRGYVVYFNRERSHQGIGQATPERSPGAMRNRAAPVHAMPVLGGLHHTYQHAAERPWTKM